MRRRILFWSLLLLLMMVVTTVVYFYTTQSPKMSHVHLNQVEMLTDDEFPGNLVPDCPHGSGGSPGNLVQDVTNPYQAYARNCCFITLSAIKGGDIFTIANNYYTNSTVYPNAYNGRVAASEFEGWWGSSKLTPFTSATCDFCDILQAMKENGYALVVEDPGSGTDVGHVWAVLKLELYQFNPDPMNPDIGAQCEYTYVNSEEADWNTNQHTPPVSCGAFMQQLVGKNLYFAEIESH